MIEEKDGLENLFRTAIETLKTTKHTTCTHIRLRRTHHIALNGGMASRDGQAMPSHGLAHSAPDMVVQLGCKRDATAANSIPLAFAMAAVVGAHGRVAMGAAASGASDAAGAERREGVDLVGG